TAEAGVDAAEAALGAARAELESALADLALAKEVLDRRRRLRGTGAASQSNLDEAQRTWRAAKGAQEAARATIAMREADLRQARARLIATENALMADASQSLPIKAPVSGRILEVRQKSETSLQAGADILEIGNVAKDLEIVVELLSTDAVRVSAGDPVVIDDWGGEGTLDGVVRRIDPSGFTKVSALGVEEQRVNAVIGFSGPFSEREALGANYRVEVSIVTWREENVLSVPSSALFRDGDGWAVFVIEGGRARLRALEIGRNNGIRAQVLKGLDPTTPVILFPGPELSDGEKVKG
ncbi:HlyD family efflux transporter periplasmic adaptor subunit, partial [uncultured Nitratireductor sp.]|uniref:efflux RND transporter periplasmic adaptor subunit n=1 Tax=uncultured Nitratireductor sp. TaxID=520953 RepID=UPI0025F4E6AB